ncbi:glycosyltransferase family 2 protein [Treponema zioleckii]|uniref:glycosyltransferase family 2 protein n=1 Tax=Treponema zioleckii TaxID=331680 RepID=UPI00168B455C|nr:glycosyltransferase [Treponema zioleckii]
MRNVTIIVPVYKDWNTLDLCIESLKEYLDKKHTVLLVNDCGPESDELEKNILNSITDFPYRPFVYFE